MFEGYKVGPREFFLKVSLYCIFRRIQSLLLPVPWYSPLVSVIMPSSRIGVKNIALSWHAALRRHVRFQVVTSRYTVRFQGMRRVLHNVVYFMRRN